ncbi:MAG: mechanosensitive ion channel family protein [Desulfuromonadaceae bacterium]|nr:mechanosensitive ion channel family protein [Desulfuromonadaceae bacterium]MDD2848385.1 mechanosensitive ion channel family protein [Desulfuromonadaceae bacterium]MDD4129219.1 mechanosensitive ion channel family protein [Desulfuromonadaceae bacterium]
MRILLTLAMVTLMTAIGATAAPPKKAVSIAPVAAVPTVPAPPEGQVMLSGKPVLSIKTRVLSFSPEDRAKTISSRLERLAKDPLFQPSLLKVVDSENTSDIISGDMVVMSVAEADALAEGKTRLMLAEEDAAKIRAAVEARNKEYSMNSLLFGALYSLLATLALVTALVLINHFLPKLITKLESLRGTYIRSIRFQSIEILNEARIVAVITSLIRGTRFVLLLGLLYLYIPLVLSFFPWTHGMATKLLDYILTPIEKVGMSVISYLPKIFFLIVIITIAHYIIKFIKFLFSEVGKQTISIPGFYSDWAEPTFKIVRFLIIAFAAVVAFPYLPGSDSPAFKGVSVFLGVLFSLGSTSAVSNIVAGVILTYMRAFKIGDRVKIADTIGDVVEKTLLITRIRTIKNVDITVPNAMVLGSHITNFSSSAHEYGLILNTTVTIGYDAPWRRVHELLIEAAVATENILELPAPFVFQTSLDDFYVSYQINAYTEKPSVMARTYSDLHQNIQEKFNEAGVEIMSPHYSTLRDGNMTTIPESYLSETYKQPPFRVSRVDDVKGS